MARQRNGTLRLGIYLLPSGGTQAPINFSELSPHCVCARRQAALRVRSAGGVCRGQKGASLAVRSLPHHWAPPLVRRSRRGTAKGRGVAGLGAQASVAPPRPAPTFRHLHLEVPRLSLRVWHVTTRPEPFSATAPLPSPLPLSDAHSGKLPRLALPRSLNPVRLSSSSISRCSVYLREGRKTRGCRIRLSNRGATHRRPLLRNASTQHPNAIRARTQTIHATGDSAGQQSQQDTQPR